GLAAFTGKLTVGKSQLLAHPVTHSGFRLQHDDLTSRTYSHLPSTTLHIAEKLAFYGIAMPIKAHITIRLGLVIIGYGHKLP
ncbi:hypothetical protein ABVL87_28195, partial [Klebsiella pneumoniae]